MHHLVEFSCMGIYGGPLYAEVSVRDRKYVNVPDLASAYRFCDVNPEDGELINVSGYTYYGKVVDLTTVKLLAIDSPGMKLLVADMEREGLNKAVHTRSGDWRPLRKGDKVIE